MTKADLLASALDELLAVSPEVEAAAVVSSDGLPIASALPPHVEEDRLAAMSAALLTLGERAAAGLGKGEMAQVFVEGDSGHVILMAAGANAVLVGVSAKEAKVGLVLFEMRKTAHRVETIMNESADEVDSGVSPEGAAAPAHQYMPEAPASTEQYAPEAPAPAAYTPAEAPVTPAYTETAPGFSPEPQPAPAYTPPQPETTAYPPAEPEAPAYTPQNDHEAAPSYTPPEPAPPAAPASTNETESSVSSWT